MNVHAATLSTCGEAAIAYAGAHGWEVFPSPPGKKQGIYSEEKTGRKWGKSADPDVVREMFAAHPDAGLCIATGAASGFFVVEGDCKNGVDGVGWLASLAKANGGFPDTVQALSPSSSWHLYFAWPEGFDPKTCEGDIAPGVDVRGHGGMVLAPPTVKPGASQLYRWKSAPDRFEVADCPDWLLSLISRREPEGKRRRIAGGAGIGGDYAAKVRALAVDGSKHGAVRSLSMTLANHGVDPALTEALLASLCPNYDANARATVASAYAKARPEGTKDATEDGVARQFTKVHGHTLRFDHDAGLWFEWSGDRWEKINTHRAYSYARHVARETAFAAKLDQKAGASVRKASFAAGVERFARADPIHAVTQDVWDRDPFLLGVPGGAVDLRTGAMLPPSPERGITKLAKVAPSRTADCSTWLRFLEEATAGDAGMVEFLRRWCGYCLTGDTREHALIFLYGPGGNGKSVFLNTVTRIMGDYATTAAMDTFTSSRGDKHPTGLALLRGARLVSASETEEGRAWAEARIKQMTGGDPITARFMRQDFFTYTPEFKLTIVGNHAPALVNVDDAARRRFNIVPFTVKPDQPDRQLEAKLEAEWPGILRWMIEGAVAWLKGGLERPDSVIAATADYFAGQDLTKQWLEDACTIETGNVHRWETSADLFKSWTDYARANGEEPGSAKAMAPRLRRHGLQDIRRKADGKTVRGWGGVTINRPEPRHHDDAGDR